MNIKALGDKELETSLTKEASVVANATVNGIAMLAEFGKRELHLRGGYKSLFKYCVENLKFSNDMAWRWSKAAEAAIADERIVERLRDGRLSVSVAATLAKHPEILKGADGMTKDQAKQKIEDLNPAKPKRDVLPPLVLQRETLAELDAAPKIKRLHLDVTEETLALAHRAKELAPNKSMDEIMRQALSLLLDQRDPVRRHERREKKHAAREQTARRPRQAQCAPGKAHSKIPLATRDAATVATGARCEFVSPVGVRCTERCRLERDHIRPLALGGADEIGQTRNLCREHHRFLTRASFPDWRDAVVRLRSGRS